MHDLLPSLYAVPITGWADFLEALRVRLRAVQVTLAVTDDAGCVVHRAGIAKDDGEAIAVCEGVVLSFTRQRKEQSTGEAERELCAELGQHLAAVVKLERRMRMLENLAGVGDRVDCGELMATFGLTPAEARVTSLLCRGRSLTEVAGECGRSLETARTHLKRALAKTQCRRQPELVALVLRRARAERDSRHTPFG